VQLYGPVPLGITLCGVSLTHPFYLVDDRAVTLSPALGGYYLMKAAHLVLDVPNGLAWSRLTQSPLEPHVPSPNPSTAQLPSSEFGPSVSFIQELCHESDASEVAVSGRPSAEDVVVPGHPSAENVVVLVIRLLKMLSFLVRRLLRMSLFLRRQRCRQICCRLSRSAMKTCQVC